jgi:hypothetical protein
MRPGVPQLLFPPPFWIFGRHTRTFPPSIR